MTEDEKDEILDKKALGILTKVLDESLASLREYILGKYHDTFGVNDILAPRNSDSLDFEWTEEQRAKHIIYGYFLRGTIQDIAFEFGQRELVDQAFENMYYTIGGMYLGTDSFAEDYVPLKIKKQNDKIERENTILEVK